MKVKNIRKKFPLRGRTSMGMFSVVKNEPAQNTVADEPQPNQEEETHEEEPKQKGKSKKNNRKNTEEMNDIEKIEQAEAIAAAMEPQIKKVKTDRGLIERTESSKIILTEDNRQVLND